MNIKISSFIFFIYLLCSLSFITNAQEGNALYFMRDLPQSTFYNPAVLLENELSIGFPFISGLNVGLDSDFNFNTITPQGHGIFSDTLSFDLNSVYNKLKYQNKLRLNADMLMLYVGARIGRNYFSVSAKEKGLFSTKFDKQLIQYLIEGAGFYQSKNTDLGNISFEITQYREVAIGISHKSKNRKIDIGGKLKLLFGRLNYSARELNLSTETSPEGDYVKVKPGGVLNMSGPIKFEHDSIGDWIWLRSDLQTNDYSFNYKNLGFAADLGIIIYPNENLNLSASIIDLGYFRFANKNFILPLETERTYHVNSNTQYDVSNMSFKELLYLFQYSAPYPDSYLSSNQSRNLLLPVKIYLGGEYNINKDLTIGFLEKMVFLNGYSFNTVTISAQTDVNENFELTGTYSVIGDHYFNIGMGCSFKTKFLNAYFATDNILSFISPSDAKILNLHFGINLLVGKD